MTGGLKNIANTAVAADGGSLLAILEWSDGRFETLFLNRSIASQGTAAYDTATSDKRLLSAIECFAIAKELEQQADPMPTAARSFIEEFVRTLKKQATSVSTQPTT
ncbi:MAG TPA: hypothetical protein VHU22_01355 [Xanthobacteraceae bacterium]|jgi:hypothetical protein|nr:hypothetical protein [Xanthobacteraceae bacterium]